MPIDIDKIWLFRIVHIDNVEYLLRNGIFNVHHAQADPDYINIGDRTLISQRDDYAVKLAGYGNLGDYVPFYFGTLSPMLLNIKTGHRGILMRPQADIVYICCKLDQIARECPCWFFTDGHAKSAITEYYTSLDDLSHVDWKMVSERYFSNKEDDYDRMRRKQAEFLVKEHVPVNCIGSIVVLNEEKRLHLQRIVDNLNLSISVRVNPKNKFYF